MATLAEVLYALPTEKLRELIRSRKMDTKKLALMPNKRQLAQYMATELIKPTQIAEGILQCNARDLRLLQLLVSGEGERDRTIPRTELLDMIGGQSLSDAVDAVAAHLEQFGLAFRYGFGIFVPGALRQFIPASLSERYNLARCLDMYDAAAVKLICTNLNLPQETKAVNIEAIRGRLIDDPAGMRLPRVLDAEETAVIDHLVQAGGFMSAMEVGVAVLQGRNDDFFRYDWQNRWKQGRERNAVDRLLALGILHVVTYGYAYNLYLIIPGDLLRKLTGNATADFWTSPAPKPAPLTKPPAAITRHTTLLRDVVSLFGFITAQEAARTNTGYIHKSSLKNLARGLSFPDERYASFLYALCRSAGMIEVQSDRMIYQLTDRGNSWLHWDALTQARALYENWRTGELWGEMYSEPLQKSNSYRNELAMTEVRQAVLNVVGRAVSGENFIDIGSVTDALTFHNPLLLSRSAALGPDLVPSPGNFVRLLIAECLYWLGAAELGWLKPPAPSTMEVPAVKSAKKVGNMLAKLLSVSPGEKEEETAEAESYRITPLGAYLIGIENAPVPPSEPREDQFIVQANAEIFVPPFLEPATLYHLLALTETPAKGAAGNTVSITRDSIRRCLDQGETASDILAFLQGHGRTGIPQNVEYLINEVSAKHGHIHIGRAQMYLQVDTPLLMKELRSRRELKGYFVRELGDTVAVMSADDPEKMLRELRKAGYLPISDDAPRKSMLRLKARSAPQSVTAPTPPAEKKARLAQKADTSVDWSRIALDDNKPWAEASRDSAAASNVVRNQALIKIVLQQAIRGKSSVEIEYSDGNGSGTTNLIIEPNRLMNDFVNAYSQTTEENVSFNVGRIQWARLTGEPAKARW